MQRYFFAIALVFIMIFMVVGSFFFIPAILPFGHVQAAATPTPRPSLTATPTPTPTLVPSPTITQIKAVPTYLIDATTGRVLIDSESNLQLPMASTTKIMTAVLAISTQLPR